MAHWWMLAPPAMHACMCGCAGLDGNATIGNITNAYKFAFWDGAVLPLGLGISLVLVRRHLSESGRHLPGLHAPERDA